MRTRLTASYIIGFDGRSHVILADGEVVFEDAVIIHVGHGFAGRVDQEIDYGAAVIGPGFIDLDALGDLDTTVLEFDQPDWAAIGRIWSESYLRSGPRDAYSPDEELFKYEYAFTQLIRNGITTAMPITSMLYRGWAESEEEFAAVAQLAGRMGLRAYLGPCYMSGLSYQQADGTIAQHYDEEKGLKGLDAALHFATRHDGGFGGRIRAFLAPDRMETQTEAVLRATAAAVRERGLPMRLHCCQSPYEFDLVRQRTGKTPYGWLQELGLLTPQALLPHGIYTDGNDDLARLAASGASIVHCPVVFARSGEALHSFSSMARRGIGIAMGTDTFPPDMIDNIRQGLNICRIMDGGARQATAADFYNAATLGGAKALGRNDIGRLFPGARADITVFDLSGFHIGQVIDPIHSMVLAGSGRDFRAAFIDGKPVMADFRVIGADHEVLAARAQRQFAKAIDSHARQAGRPGEAERLLTPSFPVIRPPH